MRRAVSAATLVEREWLDAACAYDSRGGLSVDSAARTKFTRITVLVPTALGRAVVRFTPQPVMRGRAESACRVLWGGLIKARVCRQWVNEINVQLRLSYFPPSVKPQRRLLFQRKT